MVRSLFVAQSGKAEKEDTMKTSMRRWLLGISIVGTLASLSAGQLNAGVYYWDTNTGTNLGAGSQPNGTWGTNNYWNSDSTGGSGGTFTTGTGATDTLYFVAGPSGGSGSSNYSVTVSGTQTANALLFQSSGTATLQTGTISLGSGGVSVPQYAYSTTDQGAVTISAQLSLQAAQTWTNNAVNLLTISGGVGSGANHTFTVAGAGNAKISGVISGTGTSGLTKTGSGTLTLTAANTYSGATTVSFGTLQLGDGTSGHDGTLASGSIANNGALVYDLYDSPPSYSGTLSGNGSLTMIGPGTLTLGGTSPNFTGTTTVNGFSTSKLRLTSSLALQGSTVIVPASSAGSIEFDQTAPTAFTFGGLSGSGSLALWNNAFTHVAVALTVGGNNANMTYSGALSATGSLIKEGTGTLMLTGASSHSGGTTVNAGTLQLGDGINSGSDGSLPNSVAINSAGTLLYNLAGSRTYSGWFSGSGTLTKAGPGTLTLNYDTGSSGTYSGTVLISGGTLTLGGGTTSHNGVLDNASKIIDNGSLVFNPYDSQTCFPVISGSGNLIKSGSSTSTLTLYRDNTFTGTTTINSGTLKLTGAKALQSSTVIAPSGGSIVFDSSVTGKAYTFGGLSGSGNLSLKNNAATPAGITLSVGGNDASTTYSGGLNNSGASAGSLTKVGTGTLTLTGANTYTGTTAVNGGGLVFAAGGSLGAGSGNLYVGNAGAAATTPAAVTIQGTVSVGGELDVNNNVTSLSGTPCTLTLTSGSLTVSGAANIGNATMRTDPSNASAALYQSGGSATMNSVATVGKNGIATSVYDISGGSLSASAGLVVGGAGNGSLLIHGSGAVNVSGGSGLVVGQDATKATGGSVNFSGGSLSITGSGSAGKLILGSSGGIGTFRRSGGTVSGNLTSGDLKVDGTATLVLDDTAGSVATTFGGTLDRPTGSSGTLIVIPQNGHLTNGNNTLGGTEGVSFVSSVIKTNNILKPAIVRQASASDSSGDYLTTTSSSPYSLLTATYDADKTNFANNPTSTSLVVVTGTPTIDNKSAWVVKFAGGSATTINAGKTLSINGGGMILNGGNSLLSGGTVAFRDEGNSNDVAGYIFAGSSNQSVVSSALKSTLGFVKFGPGALVLSGNSASTLSGPVSINSGTVNIRDSGALGAAGSGSGTTVAAGAALELQGNLQVGSKPLTLNGNGVGGGGALRNISGNSSWAGTLTVASPAQVNVVADSLTFSGGLSGNDTLTKAGSGKLVLTGDSGTTFAGAITVAAGTLSARHSGALGSSGSTAGTIVTSGATLAVQGGINTGEPITASGTGASGAGAIDNVQDDNTLGGSLTLAGTTLVSVDSGKLSLNGVVSGPYGLTKAGPGTLVLGNSADSFSGPLAALGGTLSVATVNAAGSSGPLGSDLSPITLGSSGKAVTLWYTGTGATSNRPFTLAAGGTGKFQVDGSNSLTLSGAIGGSGGFEKTGGGTLTLSGSNPYTGTTTVSGGTLAITSAGSLSGTSGIAVAQGGTLQVTAGGGAQLADSANVVLGGGSLSYGGGGTATAQESLGTLSLSPGQSNITASNFSGTTSYLRFGGASATHPLGATVTYSSDASAHIQFQANPPSLTNGIVGSYAFFKNLATGSVDFATTDTAAPFAISGCATDARDFGSIPSLATANTKPTNYQTLGANTQVGSVNLTGSVGIATGGWTLTLGSGGLIANTSASVLGGALIGSASGELVVNQLNTTQSFLISSNILDVGGGVKTNLVKTGPGTLTLSGANTYTGETYINQGTLEYSPASALTYSGKITAVGNLKKSGSATLTLTGSGSTFAGDVTVADGTLSVSNPLTLGSASTLSGQGTISGNVALPAGGTVALSSTGTVTGTVTVSAGTLTVGKSSVGDYLTASGGVNVSDSVSGSGTIAAGTTGARLAGSLNYTSSAGSTFSGIVSGTGKTVTLNAPSSSTALILSGINTYTGGTTIQSGTLEADNASALGSGGATLSGGKLKLNFGSTATLSLPALTVSASSEINTSTAPSILEIAGALTVNSGVTLTKLGAGTLVIKGTQSWGAGSVLQIGGSSASGGGGMGAMLAGGGLGDSPVRSSYGGELASPGGVVPEPSSWALGLAALMTLATWRLLRLRRRAG
jgi:autotransporter-associated beta strand protein